MTFDEAFSFSTLYHCHKLCRRNKQHKDETVNFELGVSRRIQALSKSLISMTYTIPEYRSFTIHEPKERIVDSLSYQHRLVQRSLCDNILMPRLESRLIYDNCACRKNKGTRFALERLKHFLELQAKKSGDQFYFLQCDIKKYFQSIPHDHLKAVLKTLNFDHKTWWLIEKYIDSYPFSEGRGIPIGNQTSQWFALFYLDVIDRFIKEKLKIKYYVRYMDDFVLVHEDKQYLMYCLESIRREVEKIGLALNSKTQINSITRGISFLGFRMHVKNKKVIVGLRAKSKARLKNNFARLRFLHKHALIDDEFINVRIVCYINHYFFCSQNNIKNLFSTFSA